jgi:hypothetical protein
MRFKFTLVPIWEITAGELAILREDSHASAVYERVHFRQWRRISLSTDGAGDAF